jgi:hypothetical protein
MVYTSKFKKPKNYDDSKFVGGVGYTPYEFKKEDTDDKYSRLTYNHEDSGIVGSIDVDSSSQDDSPITNDEDIDTSSLEASTEESKKPEEVIQDNSVSGAKTFTPHRYLRRGYDRFVDYYRQAGAPENELAF